MTTGNVSQTCLVLSRFDIELSFEVKQILPIEDAIPLCAATYTSAGNRHIHVYWSQLDHHYKRNNCKLPIHALHSSLEGAAS